MYHSLAGKLNAINCCATVAFQPPPTSRNLPGSPYAKLEGLQQRYFYKVPDYYAQPDGSHARFYETLHKLADDLEKAGF